MYFSNKNIFIELDFIRNHRSKWLGVADLISHILVTHLNRDLKFVYWRWRNEMENSYGHGRGERKYLQMNCHYFSDNWKVGTNESEWRFSLPLVRYFSTHSLLTPISKLAKDTSEPLIYVQIKRERSILSEQLKNFSSIWEALQLCTCRTFT